MSTPDDLKATIRRNMFLGLWAAERLGLAGHDAQAYANALAVGTLDPAKSDVFGRIRKDFDAAGVKQSDAQILQVMEDFMLQAWGQAAPGGPSNAAEVALKRRLTTK